jgi:hypothetical protein
MKKITILLLISLPFQVHANSLIINSFTGKAVRWKIGSIVKYSFCSPSSLYRKWNKRRKRSIHKAFRTWARYLKKKIRFKYVKYCYQADYKFYVWNMRHHILNKDKKKLSIAMTHPVVLRGTNHLTSCKTYIDKYIRGRYFRRIATHEIGHCLGINHIDDKRALMYPVVFHHSRIHRSDIQVLKKIYPFASK